VPAQPGGGETVLALDRVSKRFGEAAAVDSVSLSIRRGEIFTLLGPSGCGKTTTLRLVAGLEHPDGGEITLRDRVVASAARRLFVAPNRRNLGMVFQSYAVWPHMTVFENVAYPLEVRGLPRAAVREKVARILDLVGLGGTETRPGTLLSGGQMQRLALCRALVYEPDLLLLDEPFSNLDAKLREQMRVEVKLLQRRLGITVLFVTHDQVEALSLSDRIAVMHRGRVEQVGTPRALYEQPTSAFVRDFLGQTVVLAGRVAASASARGDARVTVEMNGPLTGCTLVGRSTSAGSLPEGAAATIAIRPEDIRVAPDGAGGAAGGHLLGTIDTLSFVGDRYEARVGLGGEHCIVLLLTRSREWREGERVRLGFPPELVSVWPA
jgi:ABC-type Fe3+/spermidine/putrescine transport system ATPase subunit